MLMLISWAAYSSTSSLSRSVHSWLAESSGTKIMSLFSFICFTSVRSALPGIVACFGGTSPSLSHGLSLFKRTFTLWSNVFSTEEDSSSDFGRDELRMTPGFAVGYEKSFLPEAFEWSGQRDSNPRSQPWQGCALPTKLCPQVVSTVVGNE